MNLVVIDMKLFLALFCGLVLSGCAQPLLPSVEPAHSAVFSSTREVRGLSWNARSHTLWAATAGGVLEWHGGAWTKWTRGNGLPANESFEIAGNGQARFPLDTAWFNGKTWTWHSAPPFRRLPPQANWNGRTVRSDLDGLDLGSRVEPLPRASTGTHISALLPLGKVLEVAIYGDGLWRFDGARWTREAANVPDEAREVTALSGTQNLLWIGTRRAGIWRRQSDRWTSFAQDGEPAAHNVQFLCRFRGVLWASTLDDGLVFRSGTTWNHVTPPNLSSPAPRQMWVWHDALWVRHGTGVVDSFDGQRWTKNALKSVPRSGIYALGGDETRLLASGWGGFAEWDGSSWEAHYDVPELKGVPVLGILAVGDEVWLATQSRGAGVWNRATGRFRWLDERAGLPDDWVTTLAHCDGHIFAGTFVGGLARLDGERWFSFPELTGENVTSLCQAPDGRVLAATRHGVWAIQGDTARKWDDRGLDPEDQALLADEHGVWIGARTSLNFCRTK